jgi:hypothetical protein
LGYCAVGQGGDEPAAEGCAVSGGVSIGFTILHGTGKDDLIVGIEVAV